MQWDNLSAPAWTGEISNRDAKEQVAQQLAAQASDGDVIGIGSGSTSFLALLALAGRVSDEGLRVRCVPTSYEISGYCTDLGLDVTDLSNARPDWCFDGADEVDPQHNLIKGRGGAFVREKLVFAAARRRFILVDDSKFVPRIGAKFKLPLEVIPEAVNLVRTTLREILGTVPVVRPAGGKDGGVITEQGGLIMDLALSAELVAAHPPVELEALLNNTVGITGTGLFAGYELEVLSG
ncbi:MAG: ribose 5-phosphate isomerase A [Candidatus Nanopelagicales bacterium]